MLSQAQQNVDSDRAAKQQKKLTHRLASWHKAKIMKPLVNTSGAKKNRHQRNHSIAVITITPDRPASGQANS